MKEQWKLEDHIKTKQELVNFLVSAVEEVKLPPHTKKKEMQWLAVACNDYLRIAKQHGWIE